MGGMTIVHLVDAFASAPFTGNPAAVCPLDGPRDASWMQRVAFELGYSETAFLWPLEQTWSLRWFTPRVEVKLCGHATLASAHTLWSLGHVDETLRFQTLSGVLSCTREGERVRMDFPRRELVPTAAPAGVLEALGCEALGVWQAGEDYLIELRDEATVRALRPDHRGLRPLGVRGVIVTARSDDPGFDFVSRFFAPGVGIDEDPATGSAHCALTPFWAARLGKTSLSAFQASERGATLGVELQGERVALLGRAVTILRGELTI
jgi:PhzF family phenazine biosynthesis protein